MLLFTAGTETVCRKEMVTKMKCKKGNKTHFVVAAFFDADKSGNVMLLSNQHGWTR